jgi:hypothetical protein
MSDECIELYKVSFICHNFLLSLQSSTNFPQLYTVLPHASNFDRETSSTRWARGNFRVLEINKVYLIRHCSRDPPHPSRSPPGQGLGRGGCWSYKNTDPSTTDFTMGVIDSITLHICELSLLFCVLYIKKWKQNVYFNPSLVVIRVRSLMINGFP